ncbi:MAG: hypothetical protein HOC82_18375 [Bacteroidetes bacterium]|nr:hypothetical protein [Bacteroidota bacterium]
MICYRSLISILLVLFFTGNLCIHAQTENYSIPEVDSLIQISNTITNIEDSIRVDLYMDIGKKLNP